MDEQNIQKKIKILYSNCFGGSEAYLGIVTNEKFYQLSIYFEFDNPLALGNKIGNIKFAKLPEIYNSFGFLNLFKKYKEQYSNTLGNIFINYLKKHFSLLMNLNTLKQIE